MHGVDGCRRVRRRVRTEARSARGEDCPEQTEEKSHVGFPFLGVTSNGVDPLQDYAEALVLPRENAAHYEAYPMPSSEFLPWAAGRRGDRLAA